MQIPYPSRYLFAPEEHEIARPRVAEAMLEHAHLGVIVGRFVEGEYSPRTLYQAMDDLEDSVRESIANADREGGRDE